MIKNEVVFFAQANFRNEMRKFGIKVDDRRRHMYLIGKTGMGKSTVLENMIVDDIRAGRGVAVVDPHGDLAEKVIKYIPEERIKDVIYFNPADMNYPIAFNLVEQVEPHLRHLVASGLIGVFQKLWADSWGPRLEYILRNAILAILDYPGSTLLGVVRMLSDKNYRKKVVSNIKDPVVKSFWEKEFASYADKFASEAVSPIQNKVGQFLSSSFMRNIVGQVESSVNMRKVMDEGKILIMNLSKGRIGEDNSALLGAMMITKIQLAAMSRVDIEESQRNDFYLYIDEFQNFSTESFANILSEARKYRLNLIMAHQYIEQLDEKVKPAVFGNVGTIIVFRVGAADAEELVKEFTPVFTEEDIVNLPKYEMYLKLMIDGIASDPFSARGMPPLLEEEKTNIEDKVIDYSRKNYASERDVVEEKIMKWHMDDEDEVRKTDNRPKASNVVLDRNQKNKPAKIVNPVVKEFHTYCSACGSDVNVKFEPDGKRPVYCKDCFTKIKDGKKKILPTPKPAEKIGKKIETIKENKTESIEEIGLSALKSLKPLNFKGEEIREKKEIDLKEGEDVFFSEEK
ncbi:MAG: type IV secretion system DNA-binding domain-containing protein [Patescibacteria group bacterium]